MGIWITRMFENESCVTLGVEGQLVADWGSVLQGECQTLLHQEWKVLLDFSGVTFIDSRGIEVLNGLRADGLKIVNIPPLIEDVIERG